MKDKYLSMEWKIGMYLGSARYVENTKSHVTSSPRSIEILHQVIISQY